MQFTSPAKMQFTIPANTPAEKYEVTFTPFCNWLRDNQIDPAYVDGTQLLTVTSGLISGTMHGFGPFSRQVTVPMHPQLSQEMEAIFFGPVTEAPSGQGIDHSAVALDDVAQLVRQLAEGREEAAAGKKKADEARDQILARLRESGKEYGSVQGQRVLHAKTVEKRQFQTEKFRTAHPELADEFTAMRAETRLEIL